MKKRRYTKKQDRFAKICRDAGWVPDHPESVAWSDLDGICETIGGIDEAVSRFYDWAHYRADTDAGERVTNPIGLFVYQYRGEQGGSIPVEITLSTKGKDAIDNLGKKLYERSGPPFNRRQVQAIGELLGEYTEEEIVQAWGRFVSEQTNPDNRYWAKNFSDGAATYIVAAIRKENLRRKEMEEGVERTIAIMRAEDEATMARIRAEEAAAPQSDEELLEMLKKGAMPPEGS